MKADLVVARLDAARLALKDAKTIQDTKSILDVASAAEIYAKRQKLSQESIDYAHDIKFEALAQLGRMLKETPKAKGAPGPGRGKAGSKAGPAFTDALTLAELGLDKKTSSIAQRLATLPPERFEQVKAGTASMSQAIRAVSPPQKKAKVAPMAPSDELKAENENLREWGSENAQNAKELLAENEALLKITEADDKLAAALAEIKKLREMNRILEERNRSLTNERNEAIRAAKSWKAKFDRAEKGR